MQAASLPTSESSSSSKKMPPSSTSSTANQGGELRCTVLSAFDLPTRDQPSFVSVTACGATVTTAAPTSRHKDRNSFKFASSSDLVLKAKTLEQLYGSEVHVEVLYETKPWLNLVANYQLKQLKVLEPTWLLLNLETPTATGTANSSGSASATQLAKTTHTANTTSSTASTSMEDVPPTLRLKVQLKGPYRPEVAAFISLAQAWFALMDSVEHSTTEIVSKVPTLPLGNYKGFLLIPAVPAVTVAVCVAPVVAGLCVLFLPIFVPLLAAILTLGAFCTTTGLLLWASTSHGRTCVKGLTDPALQTLWNTPSGQSLLYETGPRPTPVSVARVVLPTGMWGRLVVSLAIDLVGSASYLVPVVGEITDVGWAPLQTIFIMALYDTTTPNLKYLSFVEEILPFTDFVPSATIGWAAQFGPQLLLKQQQQPTSASTTNGGGGGGGGSVPSQMTVSVPQRK